MSYFKIVLTAIIIMGGLHVEVAFAEYVYRGSFSDGWTVYDVYEWVDPKRGGSNQDLIERNVFHLIQFTESDTKLNLGQHNFFETSIINSTADAEEKQANNQSEIITSESNKIDLCQHKPLKFTPITVEDLKPSSKNISD